MTIIEKLQNLNKKAKFEGLISQDYDFSRIIYLVNNPVRAMQVERCILDELAELKDTGAILPPVILPYRKAFLRLAGEYLLGKPEAADLCRSEEWLDSITFDLSSKALKDSSQDGMRNRAGALGMDFRKLLELIVLNCKIEAFQKLDYKGLAPDWLCEIFWGAFNEYSHLEKEYNAEHEKTGFFHPFSALTRLNAYNFADQLDLAFYVEDKNLMEPVFTDILAKMQKNAKALEEENCPKDVPGGSKPPEILDMMTLADEAEVVAWEIKKLMLAKVPEEDIVVICCNSSLRDALELAFTSQGLKAGRFIELGRTAEFGLLKSAWLMLNGDAFYNDAIYEVFESTLSALKLDNSWAFREEFSRRAILAVNRPFDALSDIVKLAAEGKSRLKETDIKKISDFGLLRGKSLKEVYKQLLSAEAARESALLGCLNSAMEDASGVIEKSRPDNRLETARRVLSVSAAREFFTGKSGEEKAGGLVAMASPDQAPAFWRCGHIIVCGANASLDSRPVVTAPHSLLKALGLETADETLARRQEAIRTAVTRSSNALLSYAWFGLDGKVAGVSNLVRAVRAQYNLEFNGEFRKMGQIIAPQGPAAEKAFPPSSFHSVCPPAPPVQAVPAAPVAPSGKKIKDYYAAKHTDRESGIIKISVTDLNAYAKCPREFAINMLAGASGLEPCGPDDIANMRQGSFWHKVFELSSKEAGFNTTDQNEILKALKAGFNGALSDANWAAEKYSPKPGEKPWDPETFQNLPLEEFKTEAFERILPEFASNEIARKNMPLLPPGILAEAAQVLAAPKGKKPKGAGLQTGPFGFGRAELDLYMPLPENPGFAVSGKLDRLDIGGNGAAAIVWDYKTGSGAENFSKYTKILQKTKEPAFDDNLEGRLQLPIYSWMLSSGAFPTGSLPLDINFSKIPIYGGIIKRDGRHFPVDISKCLLTEAVEALCAKLVKDFITFLERDISELALESSTMGPFNPEKPKDLVYSLCAYCDMRGACLLMRSGASSEGEAANA